MQLFPLSFSCNKNMTKNCCHDLKWEFWRLEKCKMVSFVSSAQSNISFYVVSWRTVIKNNSHNKRSATTLYTDICWNWM